MKRFECDNCGSQLHAPKELTEIDVLCWKCDKGREMTQEERISRIERRLSLLEDLLK